MLQSQVLQQAATMAPAKACAAFVSVRRYSCKTFFFFCIKAFASLSACVGKGLKMKTLGELGTPQSTKAMLGPSSHAAFQHRPRQITSLYKRLLQLFVVCLRAGEGVKIAELCVFVSYYPCEVHSIAFPQLFQR